MMLIDLLEKGSHGFSHLTMMYLENLLPILCPSDINDVRYLTWFFIQAYEHTALTSWDSRLPSESVVRHVPT